MLKGPGSLAGLHWFCQGCRLKSDLSFKPKKPKITKKQDNVEGEDGDEEEEKEETGTDEKDNDQEETPLNPDSNSRHSPRRDICPVPPVTPKMCEMCPHGLTGKRLIGGKPCPNLHTPRCINYMRHGTDKKLGCTKGANCQYYLFT